MTGAPTFIHKTHDRYERRIHAFIASAEQGLVDQQVFQRLYKTVKDFVQLANDHASPMVQTYLDHFPRIFGSLLELAKPDDSVSIDINITYELYLSTGYRFCCSFIYFLVNSR
jgi:hypothetical protein